ncbi:hypothetical protein GCM10011326_32500 [Salipiger profundus]|nr:hypothetical protein GCM10011326_32500 [Salipiger profundus]
MDVRRRRDPGQGRGIGGAQARRIRIAYVMEALIAGIDAEAKRFLPRGAQAKGSRG